MAAPVALFVYNRPGHALRTIDALQRNRLAAGSDLYVFADGAKKDASLEEKNKIAEVRKLVSDLSGFRSVNLHFAEQNKGLAASMISGIDKVFEKSDTIIVVEDDIITSENFLAYCNDALTRFSDAAQVMAVSGYAYPIKAPAEESYFLKTGACWGWATWKHAWSNFNSDAKELLHQVENGNMADEFNFSGTYDFTNMLRQQREGEISSWGVRWYASIFLKNGLTLFPPHSLTINTGMDGSGTHYKDSGGNGTNESLAGDDKRNWNFNIDIRESLEARDRLRRYFKTQSTPSLGQKVKSILKKNIFTR